MLVWSGGEGEVGGIDDDGEVGAGADVGVDVGAAGVDATWSSLGWVQSRTARLAPAEKPMTPMWVGSMLPFGSVGAGEAHGLLGVFEIGGVGGIVAGVAGGLGNAVFDEDAGDADGVEPLAGVGAFAVGDKDAIAAAGKDQRRGSGVLAVRGIDG